MSLVTRWVLLAGRVVLNEFATPPQGLLGYAQQVGDRWLQVGPRPGGLSTAQPGATLIKAWPLALNLVGQASACVVQDCWRHCMRTESLPSLWREHPCCDVAVRCAACKMLAPFGSLLSRRFPLTPMTDNACVSIHAIGPAAAHSNSNGATCPPSTAAGYNSSSSSSRGSAAQLELLAITEDPWGSYLMDPHSLETLKQVCRPVAGHSGLFTCDKALGERLSMPGLRST